VHLDLTYGPRYIATLSLLTGLVLGSSRRGEQISRLTYANFEESGAGLHPGDDRVSPILDLTEYLLLPRFANAADLLLRRGELAEFLEVGARLAGADLTEPQRKRLVEFSEAVTFLRIRSLTDGAGGHALDQLLGALRGMGREHALVQQFLPRIETSLGALRSLPGENPRAPSRLVRIVRWYHEHGQPDRALLLLSEALQLLACERILKREYPAGSREDHWSGARYFEEASEVAGSKVLAGELQSLWDTTRRVRGSLAHASLTDQGEGRRITRHEIGDLVARFDALATRIP
jgi:hypothetical protein